MEDIRNPKVIAEIGCNHRGDVKIAEEMIMIAAQFCKAYCVKFQKRNPRESLSPEEYNMPHPNPVNSYGETYGKHREFLEFDIEIHRHLMNICRSYKIEYSTSVWDLTSAREIIGLNPSFIKIPSACNTWEQLMELLCDAYEGDIHISLGMTTQKEEDWIVEFLSRKGRLKDTVLYHCTSGYPVTFSELFLLEIPRLKKAYGASLKGIGFSGHNLGIAADVAAMTLGADWIERHFTLDRTWKGTDHAASLEPDGLRRLCRDVRHIAPSLQPSPPEMVETEVQTRRKLKWDRQKNL